MVARALRRCRRTTEINCLHLKILLRIGVETVANVMRKKNLLKKSIFLSLQAVIILVMMFWLCGFSAVQNPNWDGRLLHIEQLLEKGLHSRAMEVSEEVLKELERHPADREAVGLRVWTDLADLYKRHARFSDAEALYKRVWSAQAGKAVRQPGPEALEVLNKLGFLNKMKGDYKEAEFYYRKALEICETAWGVGDPKLVDALLRLVYLYKMQGDFDKAGITYQRAIAIRQEAFQLDRGSLARSLNVLAGFYDSEGALGKAAELYAAARELKDSVEHFSGQAGGAKRQRILRKGQWFVGK